ncbi:MAG: hypothetical protein ACP5P1_15890, partial [Acidimicrobiales bacterium]
MPPDPASPSKQGSALIHRKRDKPGDKGLADAKPSLPQPQVAKSRPAAAVDRPEERPTHGSQGMSLFDATGARKYLTAAERAIFLRMAERED